MCISMGHLETSEGDRKTSGRGSGREGDAPRWGGTGRGKREKVGKASMRGGQGSPREAPADTLEFSRPDAAERSRTFRFWGPVNSLWASARVSWASLLPSVSEQQNEWRL